MTKTSNSPHNSWASTLSSVFYQQDRTTDTYSGSNGTDTLNPETETSDEGHTIGNGSAKGESKACQRDRYSSPLFSSGDPPKKLSANLELSGLAKGSSKLVHDNLNSPSTSSIRSYELDNGGQKSHLRKTSKLLLNEKTMSLESNISTDAELENSDAQSVACSETGSLMTNPAFRNISKSDIHYQSTRSVLSDSEIDHAKAGQFPSRGGSSNSPRSGPPDPGSTLNIPWPRKSSLSSGFRFRDGQLIRTVSPTDPVEGSGRTYVYEGVVLSLKSTTSSSLRRGSLGLYSSVSGLWDSIEFWEDIFCDAVAQEREAIAMDNAAGEMMERYRNLSETEKKRLEHDEDRLLSTMLYNLTSFMVMMQVHLNTLHC